jgi:hypothetical protein
MTTADDSEERRNRVHDRDNECDRDNNNDKDNEDKDNDRDDEDEDAMTRTARQEQGRRGRRGRLRARRGSAWENSLLVALEYILYLLLSFYNRFRSLSYTTKHHRRILWYTAWKLRVKISIT